MTQGSTAWPGETTEIPKIGFCEEKYRLLSRFVSAVKEMADLHQEQMHAVLTGETDFTHLETLLYKAGQRKDLAKYALMTHADSHGC